MDVKTDAKCSIKCSIEYINYLTQRRCLVIIIITIERLFQGDDFIKLSALRYFVEISKYQSFTKAAERLYISQSALSRQIQELENELGTQLFRRDYKNLKLTKDGKTFLPVAEDIVERCDRASAMFRTNVPQEKEEAPRLHVGYQRFFNSKQIYDVRGELTKDHPDLDFMMTEGTPQELSRAISDGNLDLVFVLNVYLPKDATGLRIVPFEHNRLQLIVPENHPLAGRKSVSIRELENEDFILMNRPKSPVIVDYVTHLCRENGFTPHASYYIDDALQAIELVASGKGISFLHSGMRIDMLSSYYHIAAIDIDEADLELDLSAAYRISNRKPVLMELLKKLNIGAD